MIRIIGSRYDDSFAISHSIKKFIGIKSCTDDLSKYTLYDVCAGTGILSQTLHMDGLNNIFLNDSCYYCYMICSSVFEMGTEHGLQKLYNYILNKPDDYTCPIEERLRVVFLCMENLPPVEGFITKTYTTRCTPKTGFYSVQNGMQIDAIRKEIELWDKKHIITRYEKHFLIGRLLEAADAYANVKYRYDCVVKCNPLFNEKLKFILNGYDSFPLHDTDCVTNLDIERTVIKGGENSIALFDPPFQRHDYTYQYGPPITIAKMDTPSVRGTYNLRQMEPASNFCRKAKYMTAFINALNNLQTQYVFCIVPQYDNKATFDNQKIDDVIKKMNFKRYECKKIYKTSSKDLMFPWRKFFEKGRVLNLYCIER